MGRTSSTPSQPASVSVEHYGTSAIALHWATFVLVVVVGVLGVLHDWWSDQTRAFWINVHAVVGICLWFLILVRAGWRALHAPPAPPESLSAWARQLSNSVHLALYGLLIITPIVGIITFMYQGRVLDLWIFEIACGIKENRAIFRTTEDIHGCLACAIFGLVGLHALAALWHRFRLRDGVFGRMWPGTERRK